MTSPAPAAHFLDARDPSVRTEWANLMTRSPQATLFSSLDYAAAIEATFGLTYRLAGVYQDERLVAGVLLFERKRGPYRIVVVPPLTPYTSFVFDPPLRETDIHGHASLLDVLLRLLAAHYHGLCFHLHPSLTDVRAFQWAGYGIKPLYTYRRALVEEDSLLSDVSKGVRKRYVRDGPGYRIDEVTDAAAAITALIEESYARGDNPTALPTSKRAQLIEHLQRIHLARLFTATSQGETSPEGGQVILTDGHTGYAWMGGSQPGPAMTLMLVHAMLTLHDEGVQTFDFVGANTPPIAEFKRSFYPELTTYYRVTYLARPELRLLHQLRPLF